ncbi:MAG: hypothetical protein KGL39_51815 [Patescibacteria group bacterium]|nr:hypothetical protein [Patescibacteria group bacterium]
MARTLLALVQQACSEINIPQPSSLISSTDDQAIQLLALANREGKDFSHLANKNGGWQELYKEYTFLTSAITGQTGNTTNGSTVITGIPSTAGITAGTWGVSGTGIPAAALIASVDSSTQITLTIPCTSDGTAVALSFGQIAYAMPSDFEYFVERTFWDGSYRWQLLGPIDAQEKDVIKWGISPVGPRRRFWIRNNTMFINPIPSNSTSVIAFDYYSTQWCQSSAGVGQTIWTADTDTYVLDEECFIQGLKWRFLRSKGLDFTTEYDDYKVVTARVMARNGGQRDLPINTQGTRLRLLSDANCPDTGFGT